MVRAHIELLARGGTHTSSVPCEGTAYHSNTYETGRVKFEKELAHTAGYTTGDPEKSGQRVHYKVNGLGLRQCSIHSPMAQCNWNSG